MVDYAMHTGSEQNKSRAGVEDAGGAGEHVGPGGTVGDALVNTHELVGGRSSCDRPIIASEGVT